MARMGYRLRLLALTALLTQGSALAEAAPQRLSVGPNGQEANGASLWPAFSADGRFVALMSDATNLVPNDTNGVIDIFVVNRRTRKVQRVSLGRNKIEANGGSFFPTISADGRFVAFVSEASNLVEGDTNGLVDAFVYDRATRTTSRVSVASDGSEANGDSAFVSISGNGRFVAFQTHANNLVPDGNPGSVSVFLHDQLERTTAMVSVNSNGIPGNSVSTLPDGRPVVSYDGRYVAFGSAADNLVPGDANGEFDAFVHDRRRHETRRVSVLTGGVEVNGASFVSSISANGRLVAFSSSASNLSFGGGLSKVFVHDLRAGTTSMVSPIDDRGYGFPEIAAEGRFVAFAGVQGNGGLFIRDRRTNVLHEPVLVPPERPKPAFGGYVPISGDGRWVAFESGLADHVPGDTNGTSDIFVVER